MKTEEKVVDCIFIQDKEFLKISIHEYYTYKNTEGLYSTCYLHNEDILFVLNTFRKIGKEGYDCWGGIKEEIEHNEDDFVIINISHGNDKGSFGIAELSIFNDESDPSITFLYNVDDPMNPEDSLYPFLMELEKYVPESDKQKIIPQWR
ncbi:MAG: hypothetical protein SPG48_04015 [Treponema sp.]|nr:hypothetical protein [Treponema sp.]